MELCGHVWICEGGHVWNCEGGHVCGIVKVDMCGIVLVTSESTMSSLQLFVLSY